MIEQEGEKDKENPLYCMKLYVKKEKNTHTYYSTVGVLEVYDIPFNKYVFVRPTENKRSPSG